MLFAYALVQGLLAVAPNPWAQLAENDLRAAHLTILQSHPGPVDPLNPKFRVWLERGFQKGLVEAKAARTFGAYEAVVRHYVAGFRDGHLNVRFGVTFDATRWPGFLVSFKTGRFELAQVDTSEAGLPPTGSELVECDGVSPEAMLARDVFPLDGDPSLEASRIAVTPKLLVDQGLPLMVPKHCTVKRDGKSVTFEVKERPIDATELGQKQKAAEFGAAPTVGVRRFAAQGVWVSLPSFDNDDAPLVTALQGIIPQAASWRDAKMVVLDVRGNTGGNSQWGDRIINGLWGETFATAEQEKAPETHNAFVEWRASEENRRAFADIEKEFIAQFGPNAFETKWARKQGALLASGLAAHRPLIRQPQDAQGTEKTAPNAGKNPVHARVFLLTDGRCFSACLDFVEGLMLMPGVVHVGRTTDADSVYMEARRLELPSGIARVSIPMKVYRGRMRGNNVPYVPKVRFEGDIGDTASVERWLLKLAATPG